MMYNQMVKAIHKDKDPDGTMTPCTKEIVQQ